MRRPVLLIACAWLAFSVAWFLPVVNESVKFPSDLPGWQAFRVAAADVWPYENLKNDYPVLSSLSALTTPLFILGSLWLVFHASKTLRRTFAWTAVVAFIVNAHWYVDFGSDRKDLRIGYFLWWFSFLLAALGLFDLTSRKACTQNGDLPEVSPRRIL